VQDLYSKCYQILVSSVLNLQVCVLVWSWSVGLRNVRKRSCRAAATSLESVPTVAKIVLLAFLAIAVVVVVVVFVRNSRKRGFPTRSSSGHLGQMYGAMPPMPKPPGPEGDSADDDQPRRADSA